MSSDDESSTLERRLASKLVDKLNVNNEKSEEIPDIAPEVEPEVVVNPFTEEHTRSLIQAKVDLILKVGCLSRYISYMFFIFLSIDLKNNLEPNLQGLVGSKSSSSGKSNCT